MSRETPGSIPVDSDSYPEPTPPGVVHFNWRYIGLVLIGGAAGAGGREGLVLAVPEFAHITAVIIAINVFGGFCLGLLLEVLARRGVDVGGRRALRLLIGTGVLGGFTTYSTLATETGVLLTGDRVGAAFLYALGSVVFGALATFLGVALGATLQRRRVRPRTGGTPAVAAADEEPVA